MVSMSSNLNNSIKYLFQNGCQFSLFLAQMQGLKNGGFYQFCTKFDRFLAKINGFARV
jgi:hypothetical protein